MAKKKRILIHELDNLEIYPRHHIYLSSDNINIFSRMNINIGDIVRVNGYTLYLTSGGTKKKTNDPSISYYEFGFTVKNKKK